MSLQHELRELFERIENAPWPAEREAFDRFLRRKRRRGRVMAVGVALTLAVVVGAAVLVPGMLSKDVEQVVPVAPRGTPMRIPDQGFQLVAPSGWKVSRKMTGPTPGFAIRPMVMGVVLTPRSGTLSGATITVTTEAHEPDWQGASRRPDGRQYLWRPNSDRDLVGQYAIQWPNYCKQDPITIITTCTGTRQARASLVTGYAPGGNAEVREQVQQPMQQIALSVQPITNALPPSPSPPDLLQTKVLLGNGGRGTASWEAWLEPRDGKPGFAVRFPQAKPRPIRHWQQLDPSILNAQGTSSVLQCLSWMPGYGVIVIGLARADTATVHIELNKRPLVHVPVFGRDRSVPVVAFASPRLRPAFVLVNRVTAVDAAGRMLGTENRKGRSPCRGAMSNVGRP
jgi:hypothetical protein